MQPQQRVALALGSGGARGYAHIGAIRAIEERGFDILGVSGSSMGAVIGGVFAAGALDRYTEWVTQLTQRDVVRLLGTAPGASGLVRTDRLLDHMSDMISGVRIEELPVPFTAVATDLISRRSVWFQRGLLDVAIRASIAIPGVFTPVTLDGRLLADGGLVDPVPVAPVAAVAADLTIAVFLGGERTEMSGAVDRVVAEPRPFGDWSERIRRGIAHALDREQDPGTLPGTASEGEGDGQSLPAGLRPIDIMNLSLDATQSVLVRYRLAGYPPDVLVTVPKDACATMDFHRAEEMIALGHALTGDALDQSNLAN